MIPTQWPIILPPQSRQTLILSNYSWMLSSVLRQFINHETQDCGEEDGGEHWIVNVGSLPLSSAKNEILKDAITTS